MSKKLYLIRHSYAEAPHGKQDEDRHLTQEGMSAIRALGRHLKNGDFNPDLILCSPVARTRETAINLVEELGISEQIIEYVDVIYNASVREMLAVLNAVDGSPNEIAIIGHNPTITFFGEFISGDIIGNMEPAGIVTIRIEKLKWREVSQGTGIFESYYHPNQP